MASESVLRHHDTFQPVSVEFVLAPVDPRRLQDAALTSAWAANFMPILASQQAEMLVAVLMERCG